MEVLPGVVEACHKLREAGFLLVIATNQPDVGRGLVAQGMVEAMNNKLVALLGIDAVRVCYHDGYSPCNCRKPKPGMLLDAGRALGIELDQSFMIGDRPGDIEAGLRAGCRTVYINWGQGEPLKHAPEHQASSLLAATDWILTAK